MVFFFGVSLGKIGSVRDATVEESLVIVGQTYCRTGAWKGR